MKFLPLLLALSLSASAAGVEEWLDDLDQALTVSALDDAVRTRLSGTVELEAYHFSLPAPDLIDAQHRELLNPRLTLFLDSQLGPRFYLFAQGRLDRGFDPSDGGAELRLDEYALRWTPWEDGRLNVQLGKFSTIVGRWVERHLAWDNPFINAPLAYSNVSAVSDYEAPESSAEFAATRITAEEKYEFNPILWGPVYTTGASVAGHLGKWDGALEIKNASLSSRPEAWHVWDTGFAHPTVSGRLGYRPSQNWNLGISASRGAYLERSVEDLPRGRNRSDYHQTVLAQDVSWEWHQWQVWAECFQARYEVPRVGHADTLSYYVEAKYKFTPGFYAALRWNQQFFSEVRDDRGGRTPWGDDVWRIDAAVGFRFTAHTQLKLQYDLGRHDTTRTDYGHLLAAQLMLRF